MKKLLSLLFGIIIAVPAISQVDTQTSKYTEQWEVLKALDFPAQQTFKGYKRFVFEPLDTATYIYKITREKKVWVTVPPISSIKIEAESSTIVTNVDKPTDGPADHKAYIRPAQGWLPWSATYTVPFNKHSKISFTYANGNATCNVSLNIGGVVKVVTLEKTGTSWADAVWATKAFDIGEQTGSKAVTITYPTGLNVDFYSISK